MAWIVEPNEELGLIQIVYSGTVTKRDIDGATKEALLAAPRDTPARFLTEFGDVNLKLSTLDIFSIPVQWGNMLIDRRNKSAVVVPEASPIEKNAKFHETTCRNRGWQVQVFSDRQDAIDWLTS